MRRPRRTAICALATGCLTVGGAGTAAASASSPAPLKQLLPQASELQGFSADAAVQVIPTIAASIANDPTGIRASDTAQLRRDGFVDEVEQLYDYRRRGGINTSQGLASVTEFTTPAGASRYQDFTSSLESKPSAASGTAKQTRFVELTVPRVAGAKAAAEIGRTSKRSAVNVEWVEGTCLIQLGDSVPGRTPVQAPLISAAQAIAKRTAGGCTS